MGWDFRKEFEPTTTFDSGKDGPVHPFKYDCVASTCRLASPKNCAKFLREYVWTSGHSRKGGIPHPGGTCECGLVRCCEFLIEPSLTPTSGFVCLTWAFLSSYQWYPKSSQTLHENFGSQTCSIFRMFSAHPTGRKFYSLWPNFLSGGRHVSVYVSTGRWAWTKAQAREVAKSGIDKGIRAALPIIILC